MRFRILDPIRRSKWSRLTPCTVILLYHRVAEPRFDPFGLAVSPEHFGEQMEVLSHFGCAVPLKKLCDGHIDRPSLVVTFDDGYADNLLSAKPVLEKLQIPATFFVSTGYVGSSREFWWEEVARLLLHAGPLPDTLRASAGVREYSWNVRGCTDYSAQAASTHAKWRSEEPAPTERQRLFLKMHADLQPLAHAERRHVIDELFRQAGRPADARPSHRVLTEAELVNLAASPLVEIGSHTVTHPRLSSLQESQQRFEITKSRDTLQETLGSEIHSFSYPFGSRGDYTARTTDLIREAGFKLACSAFEGTVRKGFDPFQVPRVYVRDWDGDEFARRVHERLDA